MGGTLAKNLQMVAWPLGPRCPEISTSEPLLGEVLGNSQLSGKVQTVLGTVDPSTLGMTSTHEHVFIDFVCMYAPTSRGWLSSIGAMTK